MKNKILLLFTGLLIFSSGLFYNCDKNIQEELDYGPLLWLSGVLAKEHDEEDENWKFIEGAYIDNDYIERPANRCPEIRWSPYGDTLYLLYGPTGNGCTGIDGILRQGRWVAVDTPPSFGGIPHPGWGIKVWTQGYSRGGDGFIIEDFDMVLNDNGEDSIRIWANYNWTRRVRVPVDDREVEIEGLYEVERILDNGAHTITYTGSGRGRMAGLFRYSFEVMQPLESSPCGEITKGQLRVRVEGLDDEEKEEMLELVEKEAIIDFGEGDCDGTYKVIIEGFGITEYRFAE